MAFFSYLYLGALAKFLFANSGETGIEDFLRMSELEPFVSEESLLIIAFCTLHLESPEGGLTGLDLPALSIQLDFILLSSPFLSTAKEFPLALFEVVGSLEKSTGIPFASLLRAAT